MYITDEDTDEYIGSLQKHYTYKQTLLARATSRKPKLKYNHQLSYGKHGRSIRESFEMLVIVNLVNGLAVSGVN